jgi:general secretion pathway protein F
MTAFSYKATTRDGKVVEGLIEAENERAVLVKLQDLGYLPLRIAAGSKGGSSMFAFNFSAQRRRKVRTKDLLMFTQELKTLLRAGLPLDRSLMILEQLTEKGVFQEIIHDVIGKIKGGKTLADAMADHPDVFPKVYVNMIRAGESGGVVPQVLEEVSAYLERSVELRTYLATSLIYPVIVSSMMIVSLLVMFLFVIPKFAQIFESSRAPIPLPMQVLMTISDFFTGWWWAIVGVLVLAVLGFVRWRQTPRGRRIWDERLLRTPVFGRLVSLVEVARFNRTLGTLLQSAVPLVQALTLVKEIINNQVIAETIEPIKNGVKKGDGLVGPMRKTGVFPPLSLHLIEVGEETGNLAAMLTQAADVFENDARVEVKRLIGLFEPAMILLMGVVVGLIVITMVFSIFSISEIPM